MGKIAVPRIPRGWRNVMFAISLGKAAVAGAALGIAALGLVDAVTAVALKSIASDLVSNHTLNTFAAGGGVIGVAAKIVDTVFR